MSSREEASGRLQTHGLTLYQSFEQAVVFILIGLIAIVIIAALWSLAVNVLLGLVLTSTFDPTDHVVFQSVFGMIFTVIIALEFKRSLLLVTERKETVVQARAVILIAILAIVRKLIILDIATTDALQLFALAAAILSLGGVYWLVRDQDRLARA
ncbi:MAG: putative rane protein of unknown function [Rhodospirillales bacterium]|jgi:uncharacterized membrane protein (DUF373 family)|nr:putative rane protein of unknown function [Rhodospirillales bacterium]